MSLFKLGKLHVPHKKNTAEMSAVRMTPPATVLFPMAQHIGAPATPIVKVGDSVKVNDGPLAGFIGVVDDLEPEKNRVRVIVSMFGRETPIDLELDQVETIKE